MDLLTCACIHVWSFYSEKAESVKNARGEAGFTVGDEREKNNY